jgi:hypothetical protein
MKEITYVTFEALRAPSGKLVTVFELPAHKRVNCETYGDALRTIDAIISDALYAGLPCPTRPEACAAAFSVPDGAPIAMAVDNLGCTLSVTAAEKMEQWAQVSRANERAFRRGPR